MTGRLGELSSRNEFLYRSGEFIINGRREVGEGGEGEKREGAD